MNRIQEALDWLYQQKKAKKRENLDRIKTCIQLLHLHTPYQIIHIAGTNGKGSTASYLNQMLMLAGKKVGLFVSPYVICFNERIQINGTYIQDEEILEYLLVVKDLQSQYQKVYQDTIPFFELTLLMALLHFEKNPIDILILECGIGGLLDATNGLDKDVALITNIGLDHMATLGSTVEEIAFQKLGITRPGIPCFTTVDPKLKSYFISYAQEHQVPMKLIYEDVSDIQMLPNGTGFTYKNERYKAHLEGYYQAYNASLAIEAILYLLPSYPKQSIDQALALTLWPARFEYVRSNVILDGAHNLPGIEALVKSLQMKYKEKRIKFVFTALRDKAIHEMLLSLDRVSSFYYFTTILDARASELKDFYTTKPFVFYEDYALAIKTAVQELHSNEILVITGSLHFMSEARRLLLGEESNEL